MSATDKCEKESGEDRSYLDWSAEVVSAELFSRRGDTADRLQIPRDKRLKNIYIFFVWQYFKK